MLLITRGRFWEEGVDSGGVHNLPPGILWNLPRGRFWALSYTIEGQLLSGVFAGYREIYRTGLQAEIKVN